MSLDISLNPNMASMSLFLDKLSGIPISSHRGVLAMPVDSSR